MAKYLGGSSEDKALKIIGNSDGYMYVLGQGYSTEITQGTLDIFMLRFDQSSGTLDYMYNFGGTNPDYASDFKIHGSNLIITGYS